MLRISLTVGLLVLSAGLEVAEEKVRATLYKNPVCGCCEKYADYLRANGFEVTSIEAPNMSFIKQTIVAVLPVPPSLPLTVCYQFSQPLIFEIVSLHST